MEIKNLTIRDLSHVNSFLCNAKKINITWSGKLVLQTADESFSLHEMTEKVLEISSAMTQSTFVERLSALEILRKIKTFNSIAAEKLQLIDCSSLFARAALWIQDHTLGAISSKWHTDRFKAMIGETKENVCSDGSARLLDSLAIREKAYEQLLLEPAQEQQKPAEVVEKLTTWCNERKFLKNPGLTLMQELLQLDDNDGVVTKEALTFVVSQVPHLVEEACSKIVFLGLAEQLWFLVDDVEELEALHWELARAFQTEDSSLNKSLAQAKQCAREKDFDGALQALEQAVQVFHAIEGWSSLDHALQILEPTVKALDEPEGEWGIADLFRETEELAATN